MAYKIAGNNIKRLSDAMIFTPGTDTKAARDYAKWCEMGNTPGPEFSDEELAEKVKAAAVAEILAKYEAAIAEPVECTDNDGNVYAMDGKRDSAAMMRDGIQLAELTGQTTMDITDYYNKTHAGISLENCQTIMLQQAASYATHRAKKCADREAILYPEEE